MITEKTKKDIDIFAKGLNPVTSDGEEFVLSTVNWFPLWLYIADTCEDLLSEDEFSVGFYPKHLKTKLNQSSAIKLARRLHENINNGETQKHIEKNFTEDPVFKLSIKNVKDFALFAGTSGGFILQ